MRIPAASTTAGLIALAMSLAWVAATVLTPAWAAAEAIDPDAESDQFADDYGPVVAEEEDYISLYLRQQAAEREAAQAHTHCWEVEWGGELEYRYSQLTHNSGAKDYDRDIAAEFGCTLNAPREWEALLALVTRRDNRPTSNWIPLDEVDEDWQLTPAYWLQKTWKSGSSGDWLVQWGRFEYPYDLSQIIIDNDLLLRAGLLEFSLPVPEDDDLERARLSLLGARLLGGQEEGQDPTCLLSARLDARWEWTADTRLDGALLYHRIDNADTIGSAVSTGDWRVGGPAGSGETTNYVDSNSGKYVSDFDILGLWIGAGFNRESKWPIAIEGELDRNVGAAGQGQGRADAYYAALDIGRGNEPDCWKFGVDRAWVEKDAALAAINRGEYATNYEGTRLSATYCPAAEVECRVTYTWSSNLANGVDMLQFNEEELNIYLTYGW